jgi:hypothetical protein
MLTLRYNRLEDLIGLFFVISCVFRLPIVIGLARELSFALSARMLIDSLAGPSQSDKDIKKKRYGEPLSINASTTSIQEHEH